MPKTAPTNKKTIYVDVDDEITSIIDKVKSADSKIVALVLPKRAAVFQSVVNMKLLKRAAASSKKNVVLITSEAGLMPLAGVAGLHVAKSLQSKPIIPPPPRYPGDDEVSEESEAIETDEPDSHTGAKAAAGATVAAAVSAKSDDADDTETIELDNSPAAAAAASGAAKASKSKKLKHLKVPNFERFRNGFFLGGLGLFLLIAGAIFAFVILPKAEIKIHTDTTSVVSSFDFTASTNQAELDVAGRKVPATLKELKKNETEKVPATGQKDLGTKASGEVTLRLTNCSQNSVTVPSGTIVSSNGLNFVIQQNATMQSVQIGGTCRNNDFPAIASKTVEVIAQNNGDNYNLGEDNTFTVAGFSNVSGTNSDAFTGGTSKIVKVVSQKDIDDALSKIKARADQQATDELKAQFEAENLYPLTETLKVGEPKVTATPAVDKEATEVTVATETTYNMLGIKRDDLVALITEDVKSDIDTQKQTITDDGIDEAIMRINNQPTPNEASVSFRTSVTAGPQINEEEIKDYAKGKKRGEIESYVNALPGVKDVIVSYSPFWVYNTPRSTKKITVIVEKPVETTEQTDQSNNEQ